MYTDENGLYYMRARYYSPDLFRFVNADIVRGTISNSTSLNRYAYVNGNPISGVDPRGLSREATAINTTNSTTTIKPFDYSVNYYKAIFIANKTGKYTSVVGHTELYLLGDNGNWLFTEFNGRASEVIKDKSKATVKYYDEGVVPIMYDSTSGEFIEVEGYDYVVLTGNFTKSAELAYKYHYNIEGHNFGDYNLLLNNCSDYTDMLLDAAEIDGYFTQNYINRDSLISIPAIREIQTSLYSEADSILNAVYEKGVEYGKKVKSGLKKVGEYISNIDDVVKDSFKEGLFSKPNILWF